MRKALPWLIIGGALVVSLVIVSVTEVSGTSMEPNVHTGRYLVDWFSYKFRAPERGEIVILDSPIDDRSFVKRIIGLPGEIISIQGGAIKVYDVTHSEGRTLDESYLLYSWVGDLMSRPPYHLDEESYFVLGDNRGNSFDSRAFGPVNVEAIHGRLLAD